MATTNIKWNSSIGNVYVVFQAWKVNKCCNEETWYFAQSGELHPKGWVLVRAPGQRPKKRFGIAKNVMVIYTDFLKKDETMSATDLR